MARNMTSVEVIDSPYGMSLLRCMKDEGGLIQTNDLLRTAARRTGYRNDPVQRARYLRVLAALVRHRYVVQHGAGVRAWWGLTDSGVRAATDGTATAVQGRYGRVTLQPRVNAYRAVSDGPTAILGVFPGVSAGQNLYGEQDTDTDSQTNRTKVIQHG